MFLFILGLILLVAAIIAFIISKRMRTEAVKKNAAREAWIAERTTQGYSVSDTYGAPQDGDDDRAWAFGTRIGACVVLFLAIVCLIFSVTFRVGSKEFAVLTTYGHVDGHYGAGIHLKAPWQKSNTIDGKVKTFGFSRDKDSDSTKGFDEHYTCIPTIIGSGEASCVDATIRWQITEDQAGTTYSNFGTDDPTQHFGQAVIRAQFLQVVPTVVRKYNPITQLTVLKNGDQPTSVSAGTFAPDYSQLSDEAKALMQSRVNGEATIQSVTISQVPLGPKTQEKLSQFIQEQANTRTADQKIQTNANIAEANEKLEASLEKSPGLLVKQCLDEVEEAQQAGYQLPPTFNCNLFGNSGNSGLLINTK